MVKLRPYVLIDITHKSLIVSNDYFWMISSCFLDVFATLIDCPGLFFAIFAVKKFLI